MGGDISYTTPLATGSVPKYLQDPEPEEIYLSKSDMPKRSEPMPESLSGQLNSESGTWIRRPKAFKFSKSWPFLEYTEV